MLRDLAIDAIEDGADPFDGQATFAGGRQHLENPQFRLGQGLVGPGELDQGLSVVEEHAVELARRPFPGATHAGAPPPPPPPRPPRPPRRFRPPCQRRFGRFPAVRDAGESFSRYASPGCGSLGCDARAPGVAATRASYSASDALERPLVARGGRSRLGPGLRLRAGFGGEQVATRNLRHGVQNGFDRPRDQPIRRRAGREVARPSFEAGAPAGQRETGERLDVDLAITNQCREPGRGRIARRPFARPRRDSSVRR